jgi:hypothetical protein
MGLLECRPQGDKPAHASPTDTKRFHPSAPDWGGQFFAPALEFGVSTLGNLAMALELAVHRYDSPTRRLVLR